MQPQQLNNIEKAKAILSDYTLYINKDRAFGDMEVYWSYRDPSNPDTLLDVASGYFGYNYSEKKSKSEIHLRHADLDCTFTGDDASELLNHYSYKVVSYNDASGE